MRVGFEVGFEVGLYAPKFMCDGQSDGETKVKPFNWAHTVVQLHLLLGGSLLRVPKGFPIACPVLLLLIIRREQNPR